MTGAAGRLIPAAALTVLLLAGCGGGDDVPSADDVRYLVWETCRQLRSEGATAEQAAGILQDAARHGAVIDAIEAECGPAISALFPRDP